MKLHNIPTRYALQKRAKKIVEDIDKFYQDAEEFGLSYKVVDPCGVLLKIRTSLVVMLEKEKELT